MMPLMQTWWRWIENQLSVSDPTRAPASVAQCPRSEADAREMQELVETLEALPAALARLPWHKERLWPAIWAALPGSSLTLRPNRWVRAASSAALLVIFCGVWWGSLFKVAPVATVEASYSAQPPAPRLLVTPPQDAPAGASLWQATLPSSTPQPLPAPAQTPRVARTVSPGE